MNDVESSHLDSSLIYPFIVSVRAAPAGGVPAAPAQAALQEPRAPGSGAALLGLGDGQQQLVRAARARARQEAGRRTRKKRAAIPVAMPVAPPSVPALTPGPVKL